MFNADNIHPIINLEFIEKYISDEDIFRKYCSNFQEINKKFCSELRKDRNPSCYIYIKSNNRLAYKDFGSGEHYSSIEYVMKKYNVLFKEALNIISCDFKLFKVSYADLKGQYPLGMENVSDGLIKHNKAIIHISPREWNLIDNNYWGKYYITLDLLNQYNDLALVYNDLSKNDQVAKIKERIFVKTGQLIKLDNFLTSSSQSDTIASARIPDISKITIELSQKIKERGEKI